ncbi:hypothetical protein PPTG_21928 [Phytophthora nicotianae INRA-310]|uniref:Uncharacterized protein n=1 Tax=Phytophthora nicotianae (strain INRA-310) TaxID=761204 RepID=W2QQI1_PHYN3|nr:hypothetical protein PPTG_21928 [Phytophthora nicotianae INRA-310]ETN15348.1 hypothetical protein PPTG_21928 [Phytophthora nicotianae INRA-310]
MPRTPEKKDIPPAIRLRVVLFLAERSVRGKLLRGSVCAAMEEFGFCRNSVKKMWGIRGKVDVFCASTRTPLKRGRRLALDESVQLVQAVPLCQRQTQLSLAAASGIPRTTLQRYLADGGRMYRMHHMYDTVHIDEKWFNLYKGTTKYYLTASEQLLYRTCPNKKYIGKVMYLAVVARPRYDFHRKQHFDARRWSTVVVQQDNAGPHVLENDAELETEGKVDGWSIKMRCQPPRSPDLNVLD